QFDRPWRVEAALADRRYRSGAGAGAAGLGLSRAPFPDAQARLVAINDLQEANVDALRKARMVLKAWAQLMHRRAVDIVNAQHGMGIAHGYCGQFNLAAIQIDRITRRLGL